MNFTLGEVVAANIDIGTNLNTLLLPLVAALVLYVQNKSSREFKPNGGSTMRDAVDRMEKVLESVLKRLDIIEKTTSTKKDTSNGTEQEA